jgi:hypothetical protein
MQEGHLINLLLGPLLAPLLRRLSPCWWHHEIVCRASFHLSVVPPYRIPSLRGCGVAMSGTQMRRERCCHRPQGSRRVLCFEVRMVLSPLVLLLLGDSFIHRGFLPSLDNKGWQQGGVVVTGVWKHNGFWGCQQACCSRWYSLVIGSCPPFSWSSLRWKCSESIALGAWGGL